MINSSFKSVFSNKNKLRSSALNKIVWSALCGRGLNCAPLSAGKYLVKSRMEITGRSEGAAINFGMFTSILERDDEFFKYECRLHGTFSGGIQLFVTR